MIFILPTKWFFELFLIVRINEKNTLKRYFTRLKPNKTKQITILTI